MTYYVDNGTPCSPGAVGTETTVCLPPVMGAPVLVATNLVPVDHLYVTIMPESPGCAGGTADACGTTVQAMGFPIPAACPNYLGLPDNVTLVPTNCACQATYGATITQFGFNDYRLTIN